MNKIYLVLVIGLLLVSAVSAMSINFFYHPECPHCQNVIPTIQTLMQIYTAPNFKWSVYNVSQQVSYDVDGVPTIKIKTSDCRNIILSGDVEINRWLKCELQEMSSYECPTYTKLNSKTNSYFIR